MTAACTFTTGLAVALTGFVLGAMFGLVIVGVTIRRNR